MSSGDLKFGSHPTHEANACVPPPLVAAPRDPRGEQANRSTRDAIPPPLPNAVDPTNEQHGEAPPVHSSGNATAQFAQAPPPTQLVCDEGDTSHGGGIMTSLPPLLISSIVHMLLMIILGLWILAPDSEDNIHVVLSTDGDPSVQELDGLDPTVEPLPDFTTPVLDASALPQLNEPVEVAPLPLPEFDTPGVNATAKINRPDVSRMLQGRSGEMKQAYLQLYGGTKQTEAAVFEGLNWLTRTQEPRNGRWKLSSASNNRNEAAATAMALIAYLGAGQTDRKGGFQKPVERGFRALLKLQSEEGKFSHGNATSNQEMYTHAIGTIALCEMYSLSGDSKFLDPAERAVAYCVATQAAEGGWRYQPGQQSDLSVTGWMLMALESARMAGLTVPDKTLDAVKQYLDKVERSSGDYYVYQAADNAHTSPALDAVGLLSRQYFGAPRDDATVLRALDRLLDNHPLEYGSNNEKNAEDVYYWYYISQVAHQVGGERWQRWNDVMRVQVPKQQATEGRDKGSWNPQNDRWGQFGRHYVTCLSIYMLEVYYRHLPLYSLDRR